MSAMAEPADINVDELRRRARRRLVGAVVLALGVAVVVPMLLETEQKPLGEDVSVKIPPVDDGKFVNRLNEKPVAAPKPDEASAAMPSSEAAPAASAAKPSSEAAPSPSVADPAPARASKYDTHVPEAQDAKADSLPAPASASAHAPAAPSAPAADTASASAAKTPEPARSAPAAKPAAATSNTPGTRSAESASPPSAPHHEGFAVQLAAFADDKGANSLANRLKRAGYAAYTEPLKTSKGTLWRVRVGPYPSREAALAARDKLKTEGQSGIVAAAR
jgi:DedD protein